MKIPRVMSTQHPDNIHLPFFAETADMSADDEIQEAYYAFSHLGCDEQMWDCEGKEVDDFVVKKLLSKYTEFFEKNRLGRDVFLTLRVPNPEIEKQEAKILIETLESIPRSCDAATAFYSADEPPIFEVIFPMTTSAQSLNRIYHYYNNFVSGKENQSSYPGDIPIAEWVGEFKPKTINIIPLFEDKEHLLEAHNITKSYLKEKNIKEQRVFLARSDPAMNYGLIGAVLLNKIAAQRLKKIEKEIEVKIHPIIGVGSNPFRGHLSPHNIERVFEEYPTVQTFTAQSAFKYDYPPASVIEAIDKLKNYIPKNHLAFDENRLIQIINKTSNEYEKIIKLISPLINKVAEFVPKRRMRKLHIGLFGYSRNFKGVQLPRAINFCAALYSIGLPPEIFGLSGLKSEDVDYLRNVYVNFDIDISRAMEFFNEEVFGILPKEAKNLIKINPEQYKINEAHKKITSGVIKAVKEGVDEKNIQRMIIEAAHLRKFLG